jgi:hypothetical protein
MGWQFVGFGFREQWEELVVFWGNNVRDVVCLLVLVERLVNFIWGYHMDLQLIALGLASQ